MAASVVKFHEGAVRDVEQAGAWYRDRSLHAAQAFQAEIERAIKTILRTPDRWPGWKLGTRKFLLRRFPFGIIYSYDDSVLTVWAVAHASRRPDYWSRRL